MIVRPHRSQPLWFAYMAHRVSGVCLALFLPLHFYVLSLALTDPAALDGFLSWSQLPLVKFAEFALVLALALHFFGGLRLLALEFLPWSARHKTWAAAAASGSFFVACIFLLKAI